MSPPLFPVVGEVLQARDEFERGNAGISGDEVLIDHAGHTDGKRIAGRHHPNDFHKLRFFI